MFHLQDMSEPKKKYVAKMSQDMRDNIKKEIYFNRNYPKPKSYLDQTWVEYMLISFNPG